MSTQYAEDQVQSIAIDEQRAIVQALEAEIDDLEEALDDEETDLRDLAALGEDLRNKEADLKTAQNLLQALEAEYYSTDE